MDTTNITDDTHRVYIIALCYFYWYHMDTCIPGGGPLLDMQKAGIAHMCIWAFYTKTEYECATAFFRDMNTIGTDIISSRY